MRSLTLHRLPIRNDQLARHHPRTSKPLREDTRLHIPIAVLAFEGVPPENSVTWGQYISIN
jgi:hypothetical protein